ncbi:hypothetical protein PABG_04510 [Paracoccidioides brasiliensis Pb03]|nr:hypothetical protein PABG_04510 [Paracoccidioides brasiliensis Pb03]
MRWKRSQIVRVPQRVTAPVEVEECRHKYLLTYPDLSLRSRKGSLASVVRGIATMDAGFIIIERYKALSDQGQSVALILQVENPKRNKEVETLDGARGSRKCSLISFQWDA